MTAQKFKNQDLTPIPFLMSNGSAKMSTPVPLFLYFYIVINVKIGLDY